MHFDFPYEVPYLLSDRRIDPYHWMRENKTEFQKNSEATSELTRLTLAPLNPLIHSLILEMESKVDLEFTSPSKTVGEYVYFSDFEGKNNFPTYFRKNIQTNRVEKLCNWGSKTVLNCIPSPDGRYVLFILDHEGTQFGEIVTYDTETQSTLKGEKISNNNGNVVWNEFSDGFWYSRANSVKRTDSILYHKLKTSPSSDTLTYYENDIRYEVEVINDISSIFILSSSIDSAELIQLKKDELKIIIPRTNHFLVKLIPSPDNTYLLIHKGQDNGTFYRLEDNLSYTPIYRADKDYIFNAIPLKEGFIFEKRERGMPAIDILSKRNHTVVKVAVPLGKIDIVETNYNQSTFTILHSSPIHPPDLYGFDVKKHQFDKPFNKEEKGFQITRIKADSDGVEIPITLVHKRDLKKDGKNPLLIYAYGAYGSVIDPSFCKPYSSLLDRGVVLAYVHVRGGGEFGRTWHEGAKKQNKLNSFKDLIACADYLVQEGYTCPQKMALQGASAGGTLAAGIINMRPDLFKVVLLEMPFVDAISDLSDPSVPYTPQEWEEWGNPQNMEELGAIKEWSPIDNIKPELHPSVYITAGENDVQVLSDEPYKYWAKLKKNQRGLNPVLFEMLKGGHKGDLGRFSSIRQAAPMYAFLLDQLGLQR